MPLMTTAPGAGNGKKREFRICRGGSGRRSICRVFGNVGSRPYHSYAASHIAVLVDGNAARIHRRLIAVVNINFAGDHAQPRRSAQSQRLRQRLSRSKVIAHLAAAVRVLDPIQRRILRVRDSRRKMDSAKVADRSR